MTCTLEHVSLPLLPPAAPAFSQTVGKATLTPSDGLLQASRRLDWRFLLADPTLGRVAYIGQARGSLLPALELFSTTVQVFAPATNAVMRRDADGRYDVVVANDPTVWVLQQAVGLLRPGGCLYIEVRSALQSLKPLLWSMFYRSWRRPGLGRPQDYVAALRQLGLHTVEPFWFWPNFEACTRIIPLRERDALLYTLAPRRATGGVLDRWQMQGWRRLAQTLYDSGLLELAVPCFGIVAR
jgi:hypothetical protein